jgi:C4-dicarboxylate-specific signal transduction histidine kinase
LAHELNNPLTGLKSYVQSLSDEHQSLLPLSTQSDLQEILKATDRCQKIIRNFIDFSQKKEPILEKVIFADVLQNTLILLKTALRQHRLFIDVKPVVVVANSHDLQQVLFNLIKNSCQAMLQPGVVKIYQEENERQYIFSVEDSGPGFDESILKNIFHPFMTTKKQGEGTGLGLYLSKRMMNNMKADLCISALQKQGAKISLIFDKI